MDAEIDQVMSYLCLYLCGDVYLSLYLSTYLSLIYMSIHNSFWKDSDWELDSKSPVSNPLPLLSLKNIQISIWMFIHLPPLNVVSSMA